MDDRVPINGLPPGFPVGRPSGSFIPYAEGGLHLPTSALGKMPTSSAAQPLYVPPVLPPSALSGGALSSKLSMDYANAGPAIMSDLSGAQYAVQPSFGGAPILYHPSPTAPMAGYISSSFATQQALFNAQVASSLLPPYYAPPPSLLYSDESLKSTSGYKMTSVGFTQPERFASPLYGGSFQSITPGTPEAHPSPSTLQKPTPTKATPGNNPFAAEYLFGASPNVHPQIKRELMSPRIKREGPSPSARRTPSSLPPSSQLPQSPSTLLRPKVEMPAKPKAILVKPQPVMATALGYPFRPLKMEHPFAYHPYAYHAQPAPMQPRQSHSLPLRLPEPTGSFESHLSSLSKVITATFGQAEQMSINHQKLAQISQQSVIAAVAQQHRELEKRKDRERKDKREVIVIKEESQDVKDLFRPTESPSHPAAASSVIDKTDKCSLTTTEPPSELHTPLQKKKKKSAALPGSLEKDAQGGKEPSAKCDVYSFESEGDEAGAKGAPLLPSFKSKPAFSSAHRKRTAVADEVTQYKFPVVTESCARATQFTRKGSYDMFDFLASRHRKPPRGEDSDDDSSDDDGGEEISQRQRRIDKDLHMVMQFYSLKETARQTVGVYRSRIHRRGVFAKRPIDAGEMVIEYSGELIRAVLTDKREQHYKARGIDCYMFKIDEDEVVDATMHGNAARFINHSCDPNCYSKCIEIFGKKHIVIYSQRRIKVGEELTYDYKFPKEEVKVPCTCGARKCRRYLN